MDRGFLMNLKVMGGLVLLGLVTACSDSLREEKDQKLGNKVVYKKVWAKDSLTPQEQMLDTLAGGDNPNSSTVPVENKWNEFEKDIRLSSPRANSLDSRAALDPSYNDQLL